MSLEASPVDWKRGLRESYVREGVPSTQQEGGDSDINGLIAGINASTRIIIE